MLGNLVDSSPHVFVLFDKDLYLKDINKAGEVLLNKKKEDLINKHASEIYPVKTREYFLQLIEDLNKKGVIIEEFPLSEEYGKTVFHIHLFKLNGDIGLVATDITDKKKTELQLKESKTRFEKIVESVDSVIYSFDPEGQVLFVSDKIRDFGVTPEQFYNDRKMWLEMIHPDDAPAQEKNFLEFLNNQQKKLKRIYRIISGDKTFWVHDILIKSVENNRPVMFYGSLFDITSRKEAEEEKAELQEQIERYSRQLEKKIKKLEKEKVSLTKNEKITLSTITSNPILTDQQLSDLTNIKRPTLTAIRNRLYKEGWIKTVILPDFHFLKQEIISFVYIENYNQVKEKASEALKNCPHCFFSKADSNFCFIFFAFRDMKEAKTTLEKFSSQVGEDNIIRHSYFVVPTSEMKGSLQFEENNLKLFDNYNDFRPEDYLSSNQKELMYMIAKNPHLSTGKLQKETRLSKQTITKIKKDLFSKGYIKKIVIPNTKKLNYKHHSLIYKNTGTMSHRSKNIFKEIMENNKNAYFGIMDEEKFIIISGYQNRSEMERDALKTKDIYQKGFQTLESPQIFILDDPNTLKIDFSGIIYQSLGFENR